MVEPIAAAAKPRRPGGEDGFTLIEVMIAMFMLSIASGYLLMGLAKGANDVAQGALVRDAARIAEIVQERLEAEDVLGRDIDAVPPPLLDQQMAQYPGLRYDVEFEGRPLLGAPVYCRLTVRWLRRGEEMHEIFRFPLPRGRPLPIRIREAQENSR